MQGGCCEEEREAETPEKWLCVSEQQQWTVFPNVSQTVENAKTDLALFFARSGPNPFQNPAIGSY